VSQATTTAANRSAEACELASRSGIIIFEGILDKMGLGHLCPPSAVFESPDSVLDLGRERESVCAVCPQIGAARAQEFLFALQAEFLRPCPHRLLC
jgi:hypothetical protein